jgi:hypothetical protein
LPNRSMIKHVPQLASTATIHVPTAIFLFITAVDLAAACP